MIKGNICTGQVLRAHTMLSLSVGINLAHRARDLYSLDSLSCERVYQTYERENGEKGLLVYLDR